mmetsp:Transcript_49835/g.161211  ORF Transcript_49835/g.161211 Transcript_49835/m.161211 type:complete len:452 (+) Transcript_49835:6151-7506(+)
MRGVLALVPTACRLIRIRIDHLPENLDGGLRSVCLLVGHVQVVNHEDAEFARGRSIDAFLAPVQLGVHKILCLRAFGLGGEPHDDLLVIVLVQGEERLLHVRCLARACGAAEKQLDAVIDAVIQHIAVAHIVEGLDDKGLHSSPCLDGLRFHGVQPTLPCHVLGRVDPIEDRAALGQLLRNLLERLEGLMFARDKTSEEGVEIGSRRSDAHSTNGPNAAEHGGAIDHVNDVLLGRVLVSSSLFEVRERKGILDVREHQIHEALHQVRVLRRGHLLALFPEEVQARLEQPSHHVEDLLDFVLIEALRHASLKELVDERIDAHEVRLEVHHAVARNRRGGRLGHILRFHDRAHIRRHRDDLSAVEAQLLVLVHDGVHVLDPHGVDRPIEDQPLSLICLIPAEVSEQHGDDAVGPLVGDIVKAAVETVRGDALRVQPRHVHNAAGVHRAGQSQV